MRKILTCHYLWGHHWGWRGWLGGRRWHWRGWRDCWTLTCWTVSWRERPPTEWSRQRPCTGSDWPPGQATESSVWQDRGQDGGRSLSVGSGRLCCCRERGPEACWGAGTCSLDWTTWRATRLRTSHCPLRSAYIVFCNNPVHKPCQCPPVLWKPKFCLWLENKLYTASCLVLITQSVCAPSVFLAKIFLVSWTEVELN